MGIQARPHNAMAFYNPEGFIPAFKQASAFAGEGGRVATLPDIIEARLAATRDDFCWRSYFTTLSAEYVGYSKAGNPIAIVAHGVGPMSTFAGIMKAYSHESNDKTRQNRGGRISREEFLKLESGAYGEVDVIDLVATWNRRDYQFSNHPVTGNEIADEPLWRARLGKKWFLYTKLHSLISLKWEGEQTGKIPNRLPCIIAMDDASNCSYSDRNLFECLMAQTPGTAIAHLLSIGGLGVTSSDYYVDSYSLRESRTSLASDVDCHEWWNGVRLVGVRPGEGVAIHPGVPRYSDLLAHKAEKLWTECSDGASGIAERFWHLVRHGDQFYTDYPKKGECMDNAEPEFQVIDIEEVDGGPDVFRTTIGGYHGFFMYGINEVERIAPHGANAYILGEPQIEYGEGRPTHHIAPAKFYRVMVDTSRRLVRMEDIYRNYDLMMSLVS